MRVVVEVVVVGSGGVTGSGRCLCVSVCVECVEGVWRKVKRIWDDMKNGCGRCLERVRGRGGWWEV